MMHDAHREYKAGALDNAIRYCRASLHYYPTPEAHTYLGLLYSKQRRFNAAIAECHNAIALDPSYGNPYNDIGAYLIRLEQWDEAREWLEKALDAPYRHDPALPYMNLALIHLHHGDKLAALDTYRKALESDLSFLPALDAYQNLLGQLN